MRQRQGKAKNQVRQPSTQGTSTVFPLPFPLAASQPSMASPSAGRRALSPGPVCTAGTKDQSVGPCQQKKQMSFRATHALHLGATPLYSPNQLNPLRSPLPPPSHPCPFRCLAFVRLVLPWCCPVILRLVSRIHKLATPPLLSTTSRPVFDPTILLNFNYRPIQVLPTLLLDLYSSNNHLHNRHRLLSTYTQPLPLPCCLHATPPTSHAKSFSFLDQTLSPTQTTSQLCFSKAKSTANTSQCPPSVPRTSLPALGLPPAGRFLLCPKEAKQCCRATNKQRSPHRTCST